MLSLIAALTKNNVIGLNNTLPWRLPADMKYFAEKTTNKVVIMGRKSWDSLPAKFKPLPNRHNIIVSRQDFGDLNVEVINNIQEVERIKKLYGSGNEPMEVFVIGGAEIYNQTIDMADRLYLTEIDAEVEGDTFFPFFDKSQYTEVSRVHHAIDEKHKYAFDFVVYDKK